MSEPHLSRWSRYLNEDIWRIQRRELSFGKAAVVRVLRIAALSVRGFLGHNVSLRASALTFYSLLSIVPIAAMAFGIAKGFGFERRLQAEILENLPGQEEVLIQVVSAARRFIESTKGGLIAGIGIVVLLWTVVKMLSNIEAAFNHIWEVRSARSPVRKFADYLSIMLIGPILLILSGSVTVFITTQVETYAARFEIVGMVSPVLLSTLRFTPYFLGWLLLTVVYMVMPNTRVRWTAALTAGIIAGTVYQIVQWSYFTFQVGVARYNAVYGSFAALPLFLIWLQISWLVVLLGGEISHAVQNADRFEFEQDADTISRFRRHLFSLRIVQCLAERFSRGDGPTPMQQISEAVPLPQALLSRLLGDLMAAGIVSRTDGGNAQPPGYQPAQAVDRLTVHRIVRALDNVGAENDAVPPGSELQILEETLREIESAAEAAPANRPLTEIQPPNPE
jgi:membrane protein